MPVAYVTTPGAAVKADAMSLLLTRDDQTLASIELIHLDALVVIGRIAVTTPAIYLLLKHETPLVLMSRNGRIRGRLAPFLTPSVNRRLAQAALLTDHARRLPLARRIVSSKIQAMRRVLIRYAANHPDALPSQHLATLDRAHDAAEQAASIKSLLGHEGTATAAYWRAFARMNRSDLEFRGRSRRPPADPVNALLSFTYALLLAQFTVALEAASLDPYIGIYHETNNRRPALALDLMEPFRHAVADRLALRLINRKQLTAEHFRSRNAGWWLTRPALRILLPAFEEILAEKPDQCLVPRTETDKIHTVRQAIQRRVDLLARWLTRDDPDTPSQAREAA